MGYTSRELNVDKQEFSNFMKYFVDELKYNFKGEFALYFFDKGETDQLFYFIYDRKGRAAVYIAELSWGNISFMLHGTGAWYDPESGRESISFSIEFSDFNTSKVNTFKRSRRNFTVVNKKIN